MKLIFEHSSKGQNKYRIPSYEGINKSIIPDKFLRNDEPLPDVAEPEVVRHYNNLSRMNFGVDNGMYPLGSCTMKYNPKINEKLAKRSGFADLHPLSDESCSQGALRILYDLSDYLCRITGFSQFTLAPAAGSHGELTGVMIIKKFFESTGDKRDTILIPDSAHGTNPATVAMCGFKVKEVPSDSEGNVDIEVLKSMLNENVAAMMLTSPNTLGLYDRNLAAVSRMLHENGSLFYGDGANLNATMGRTRFKDMGFDMMHINLHKTFSTPHGGGGPGSGPLGVTAKLAKFLPIPCIEKIEDRYILNFESEDSIGRIHSFYGNFAICLRAYIYIRMLGADGIREAAETAVLNANYLMARLKKIYNLPIDRTCMHEFVLNDKGIPNGITTNEIAKRILDYGFHAPTVYFPLLISGAMMIEPTETESLESLDRFVEVLEKIRKECDENPEAVLSAPGNTPVRRVDTVLAAKTPVLTWDQ